VCDGTSAVGESRHRIPGASVGQPTEPCLAAPLACFSSLRRRQNAANRYPQRYPDRGPQDTASVLDAIFLVLAASSPSEIEAAFATLVSERAGALVVSGENFFLTQRDLLVRLAAHHAVPTVYAYREFVFAGGLISYGTNLADAYRQVGINTGRILKGEKPADLPVQQVTKVELAINLKTAKTLGLTIPLPLLGRADEVIE
jgi:putative ABC transport system substrate-binding protein